MYAAFLFAVNAKNNAENKVSSQWIIYYLKNNTTATARSDYYSSYRNPKTKRMSIARLITYANFVLQSLKIIRLHRTSNVISKIVQQHAYGRQ